MDGGIKLRHVLVAILIGGIVIACGVYQGKKEIAEPNTAQAATNFGTSYEIIEQEPIMIDAEVLIDDPNVILENLLNTPPPPTVIWQRVLMDVSAYCSCEICCERWAKIPVSSGKRTTASGHIIKEGHNFVIS